MLNKRQMSETYAIGAVLATVGGFLDAYTYICKGEVFANAQTGNIVLMGIKIAQGNFIGGSYYLIPILAFLLGIIIAEATKQHFKNNKYFHWRQIIIAIEIIALIAIGFFPREHNNMISNVLVSFVCSLQVQSFRKIGGKVYATTMCTGNLRSATEYLYSYKTTKNITDLNHGLQYYGIIAFFILGAAIGAMLSNVFDVKAIFFACGGLVLALGLMFVKPDL